jgi:hypothetical protein
MRGPAAQLLLIGILLTSVLVTGTVGFYTLEGWGLFDSFYMALTTLTTVGYKEVHPLSETARGLVAGKSLERLRLREMEETLEA